MEFENIITLIQTVSESKINNFELEDGEFSLSLSKDLKTKTIVGQGVSLPPVAVAAPAPTPVAAPDVYGEEAAKEEIVDGNVVTSPLVGTFYSAPSPEEEPFVKVGDEVCKGQVLGIVEAMKLMNDIECEYNGIVTEILVDNETVVEYGQPLFVVK